MTPLENKARIVLRQWIQYIPENEAALRLIEAIEPIGSVHPGDRGEVTAIRNDEIKDAIADLEKTILTPRKR